MNSKKYQKFMNSGFVGMKEIFELLTNKPFNKKGELTQSGENVRKQLIATVKGLEHIGLIETNYSASYSDLEDEIDEILWHIEYEERKGLVIKCLERIAEEDGVTNYEIVEDSYEYEYGLMLIVYDDEGCEDEDYHICIDIMNCDEWLEK